MVAYQNVNFLELKVAEVCDYVIGKHHSFAKEMLRLIAVQIEACRKVDRVEFPEIDSLNIAFTDLRERFEQHMGKEEHILFPLFKNISNGNANKGDALQMELLNNPLKLIEQEHLQITKDIAEIRRLTNNYTAPVKCSQTLKLCFAELLDFEQDYHKHIHLENNLLFPKVLEAININTLKK